jgi:hypothetical protein
MLTSLAIFTACAGNAAQRSWVGLETFGCDQFIAPSAIAVFTFANPIESSSQAGYA